MEKNIFQYGVIAIMIIFILGGVAVISTFRGDDSKKYRFEMWGEIPESEFNSYIQSISQDKFSDFSINYTYKPSNTFSNDLIEALSNGQGPDLILSKNDKLMEHSSRILPISFEILPLSTYQETYIPYSQSIYQGANGWRGLPLAVDPLVLFSNQDILASQGVIRPPQTWQDIPDYINTFTTFDEKGGITQSAFALGTFDNIAFAKQILLATFFQAENPLVIFTGQQLKASFEGTTHNANGAEYLLSHYIQYSNPQKSLYTWNSLMPRDSDEFIAGRLVSYIAPASNAKLIEERNPNLSWIMTMLPQAYSVQKKATYGDFYGISIIRNAEDSYEGAVNAVIALTQPYLSERFSNEFRIAPSTRESYSNPNKQVDFKGKSVIHSSGLISQGFIDPHPSETTLIFQRMINDAVAGVYEVRSAVEDAKKDFELILNGI